MVQRPEHPGAVRLGSTPYVGCLQGPGSRTLVSSTTNTRDYSGTWKGLSQSRVPVLRTTLGRNRAPAKGMQGPGNVSEAALKHY